MPEEQAQMPEEQAQAELSARKQVKQRLFLGFNILPKKID
jgi:hypothetical protein